MKREISKNIKNTTTNIVVKNIKINLIRSKVVIEYDLITTTDDDNQVINNIPYQIELENTEYDTWYAKIDNLLKNKINNI